MSLFVKQSGAYVPAVAYVKQAGVYVPASAIYEKRAGVYMGGIVAGGTAPVNTIAPVARTPSDWNVTCSTGTWSGDPTGYTYLWYRREVFALDHPAYWVSTGRTEAAWSFLNVPASQQLNGYWVKVFVTSTNAHGSASVWSNQFFPYVSEE